MLIFVKLNRTITFSYIVNPSDTIGSIKDLIYKDSLINPHYQRLTYHNDSEDLEDEKTLLIIIYKIIQLFTCLIM